MSIEQLADQLIKLIVVEADSKAARQAKKAGLTSAGYGNWKDKSGAVVAKSAEGGEKLIKVKGNKPAQKAKASKKPTKPIVKPTAKKAAPQKQKPVAKPKAQTKPGTNIIPIEKNKVIPLPGQQAKPKQQVKPKPQPKQEPQPEPKKVVPKEAPLQRAPVKGHITSQAVVDHANKIFTQQQPELNPEQIHKEQGKAAFLSTMIDAIVARPDTEKGAGKYTMSRDDLETYKSFLAGNKPNVPKIDISDDDLSQALDIMREKVGKSNFGNFVTILGRKGTPPRNLQNVARARAVLKSYLSTGGISYITGKHVPFSSAQLDHMTSLSNGGVDGGDNWGWVEARFNQFKREFSDEQVQEKIKALLSKTPEEEKLTVLQKEYEKAYRSSYANYFKHNGFGSLSQEEVVNASGEDGKQFLKAIAESAKISYYEEAAVRASGRVGGGAYIGNDRLKEKILKQLKPMPAKKIKAIDDEYTKMIQHFAQKKQEIGSAQAAAAQAKKAAKQGKQEQVNVEFLKRLLLH